MKKNFYLIILIFSLVIISIYLITKPYFEFIRKTLNISFFKTLISQDSLKKYLDAVNFLVLGIPGENYEGPYLSDTIIIFSYNLKTNQIVSISLPRDIWSETLKDKINSAYAYGYVKKNNPEDGIKLAKAEVTRITGIPIHYGLVINFNEFKELIDILGGIEVEVENSFTDYKFPIPGKENDFCGGDPEFKCRYEKVSFTKGKEQTLNSFNFPLISICIMSFSKLLLI